jgi:hypothetical protein
VCIIFIIRFSMLDWLALLGLAHMSCGIIISTAISVSEIRTTKPMGLEDTAQHMAMERLVDSWHPVDSAEVLARTINFRLSPVRRNDKHIY